MLPSSTAFWWTHRLYPKGALFEASLLLMCGSGMVPSTLMEMNSFINSSERTRGQLAPWMAALHGKNWLASVLTPVPSRQRAHTYPRHLPSEPSPTVLISANVSNIHSSQTPGGLDFSPSSFSHSITNFSCSFFTVTLTLISLH